MRCGLISQPSDSRTRLTDIHGRRLKYRTRVAELSLNQIELCDLIIMCDSTTSSMHDSKLFKRAEHSIMVGEHRAFFQHKIPVVMGYGVLMGVEGLET